MSSTPTKTDNAQLKQLLLASEDTLRIFTGHSPNHITVIGPDGTILFVNQAVNEHTIEETMGMSIYDDLTNGNETAARKCINKVLSSSQADEYRVSYTDKKGNVSNFACLVYPIIIQGKTIALAVEARNISKQLNYTLLTNVISHSPIIIWAFDTAGIFTLSEGMGLKEIGLKAGEVVGKSIFELYKEQPELLEDAKKAINGEAISTIRTVRGRIFQSYYKPIYDADGNIASVIGLANDITEIRQIEEQKKIMSSALEQTADLVMITDVDGIIQYVNPAFEIITGFTRSEVLGKKPSFLRSGKQDNAFYKNMWEVILRGDVYSGVLINQRKDQSYYYEEKTITPIRNKKKEITNFVATGKDISERMRTQERLHYMAHHDALTKLPNRTLFLDRLRQAMARARWHNRLIAVMFMDLDRFKNINDTLGHNVGDKLLVKLTQRLSNGIRAGDTVARFGGDEFAVLLDDIASEKDVSQLAKKMLDTLVPAFHIDGREFFITASIGVSIFPNDGEDSETLLRNSDVAMYRAKDMGRNTYQFYSDEMSARAFERLTLENSLRHALKREELFLLYQPQIELTTKKIIGVEALLRWQHPDLGVVSPSKFVPLLEETGLIVEVGHWALKSACMQAHEWHQNGFEFLRLSVNLSGRQLNNPELTESFHDIIQECQINPQSLELELTESMLMRNASKTVSALNSLSQHGIRIAIDDFGTGYSSLNYLRRFPITTLKIDRSFIRDVVENSDDAAITSAIIVMAQSLNLNVIAEGVETESQLSFLQGLGCHEVQGNFFSPPVSANAIGRMLEKQTESVPQQET